MLVGCLFLAARRRRGCRSTQPINAYCPFDILRNIPAVDQPNTKPNKTQQKQMIGSRFTKGSASTLIDSKAALTFFVTILVDLRNCRRSKWR
jgi:hypothetical protein